MLVRLAHGRRGVQPSAAWQTASRVCQRDGRARGRPAGRAMTPAEEWALGAIRSELGRLARHDDESIVNDLWVRRRYDGGRFANYGEARRATVTTAWHEAGHAVAALAVGARFRSASIHPGRDT